jgi:membrane protein required for colicin V production
LALTALDILVFLTVGLGAALGFSRGFVSETVSLAAWILAIFAVKLVHTPAAAMLVAPVGTESGAAVLAFALVFGITFLAVKMAGKALGNSTKGSLLGPFDRVLGLAFGALKGLIAATLVFLFVSLVFDTLHGGSAVRPKWMTESRTYPLLRASSASVVDFIEKRRAQ